MKAFIVTSAILFWVCLLVSFIFFILNAMRHYKAICPECKGAKRVNEEKCSICNGEGEIEI